MTSRPDNRRRDDDFLEMPAAAFAAPFLGSLGDESGEAPARPDALGALRTALAGRYEVERELGRGGMATVFLARDRKHGRTVAIKVLHPDVDATSGIERFVREIETVAALVHPHILPLFDSGAVHARRPDSEHRAERGDGEGPSFLYYAMPYIEGESLRDRIAREGPLPVPVALRIAREVADALAYAHGRGVVHRDIKPANILLTERGSNGLGVAGEPHALLADFGIARVARVTSAAGSTELTHTGVAVGTPAYMSPEQAMGERDIDGRSDVYSLGCVLYEMLAGEPPFAGANVHAMIGRRLGESPPRVRRVRPAVRTDLEAVVARAMAPFPADRFQTAAEFLDALVRAEAKVGYGAGRWRRATPRVLALTIGMAALAASIGAVILWRARPTIDPSASAIAVLPPVPVTSDTALARLGRELVITVSANLDGVGGIRTTDALTVLANVHPAESAPSLAQALGLARRFGARSIMRATLLRVGDSVRVDAVVHAVGRTEPLTAVSVSAPAGDIAALTERVTWALLRGIWRREGAPTPSLAAVTTSSIPALRPFLDGERAIAEGRWRDAAASYERAFTEDTTFVLAYWRYALARDYWSLDVDPTLRAKYRDHRDRLPPRERLHIEAGMADSMSVRYGRARALTERFPDYWFGWWSLAELLAHSTPLIGTSSADLRLALERLLALNPRMAPALQHLFWVAVSERDTVLSGRVLRELTALRYDSTSLRDQGYDELDYFRYLDALARSGGFATDTMVRENGVRFFSSFTAPVDPARFALGISQYGFPREQVAFASQVIARGASRSMGAAQLIRLSNAQAARGAWDSSLVALDEYAARVSDSVAPVHRYRVAVVGEWLGALEPGTAAAEHAAAVKVSALLSPAGRAELAWLDGLLAASRRDANALASAGRAAAASDSVTGAMLQRSLVAFGTALAGNRAGAADTLMALERERAELGWSRYRSDDHPFLTAVNRLAAGRWLRERGDPAEAARVLTWAEGIPFPLQTTRQANAMVRGLAYLERARAAEALGMMGHAADYYRRFLWHYDAPTALHRHLLDEAREALNRLGLSGS